MSEEQILQLQRDIMDEQDEHVRLLSESVQRQREIGLAIRDEADLHNRLLDDLHKDVDRTESRLTGIQRVMKNVTKKQKIGCLILIIVLLVAIIATLAATKWGCAIFKPRDQC